MEHPTQDQLLEEVGLKEVSRKSEIGWRHGTDETVVFFRVSDSTYWLVNYRLSTDGEYHGIRENDYTVNQVTPKKKTITVYE